MNCLCFCGTFTAANSGRLTTRPSSNIWSPLGKKSHRWPSSGNWFQFCNKTSMFSFLCLCLLLKDPEEIVTGRQEPHPKSKFGVSSSWFNFPVRNQKSHWVTMTILCNATDLGTCIFPTHRRRCSGQSCRVYIRYRWKSGLGSCSETDPLLNCEQSRRPTVRKRSCRFYQDSRNKPDEIASVRIHVWLYIIKILPDIVGRATSWVRRSQS